MNAKCDYCDQRATTLAGDTNGVLVCEDHVRLFAEREIAAAIDHAERYPGYEKHKRHMLTSPPAVAASTGTSEDVEALAKVLRRHNDLPDGNNRYTSDLQDALFNVWAEADDNVGDYEIGERLAEAAIKSITDTASDWLAAQKAAARADERERWERAAQRLGELWITPRLLQTLRAYIAREGR